MIFYLVWFLSGFIGWLVLSLTINKTVYGIYTIRKADILPMLLIMGGFTTLGVAIVVALTDWLYLR